MAEPEKRYEIFNIPSGKEKELYEAYGLDPDLYKQDKAWLFERQKFNKARGRNVSEIASFRTAVTKYTDEDGNTHRFITITGTDNDGNTDRDSTRKIRDIPNRPS